MEKKLSLAQNATYNTVGVIYYCFCQWAVTMVVTRAFSDYTDAGILQLAISITNIFLTIANYNIRTFQISDVADEYCAGDYVGMRIITAGAAPLLCLLYSVISGYTLEVILCIFCYMIFKVGESAVDVLSGIDQRHYRMDYVGLSFLVRGTLSLGSFVALAYTTQNLLLSIIGMAVTTFAAIVLIDIRLTCRLESVKPIFCAEKIKRLFVQCLPSVIAAAAFTAVSTVPRQFLENMSGKKVLGYYATVATPLVIVQVLATSIFNPLLTDLAVYYHDGEVKRFRRSVGRALFFVAVLAAVAYAGAFVAGEWALTLVYGEAIRPYVPLMYAILACTILYTVCWLAACILIVMRKLVFNMISSLIALAVSAAIGRLLIARFGMNGVSYTVIVAYLLYIIVQTVLILRNLKRREHA